MTDQLRKGNALYTIRPYKDAGTWMFDDPAKGIRREALVAGMPEIIERATEAKGVLTPEDGFTVIFSSDFFPGHDLVLERDELCEGGNSAWYRMGEMRGWLCSCLLNYFPEPPARIFVQVQP